MAFQIYAEYEENKFILHAKYDQFVLTSGKERGFSVLLIQVQMTFEHLLGHSVSWVALQKTLFAGWHVIRLLGKWMS